MNKHATVARGGTVVATIADLIVAAATGRTLRVAVGCTHPAWIAFADHLTQALRARGRQCHHLTPRPAPTTTDRCMPAHSGASNPTISVITGATPGIDETDLCRINIQLYEPTQSTTAPATGRGPDGQDRTTGNGEQPNVIIDYLDPGGPTIRHLGPALTQPDHQRAGSQSDRRLRPP